MGKRLWLFVFVSFALASVLEAAVLRHDAAIIKSENVNEEGIKSAVADEAAHGEEETGEDVGEDIEGKSDGAELLEEEAQDDDDDEDEDADEQGEEDDDEEEDEDNSSLVEIDDELNRTNE